MVFAAGSALGTHVCFAVPDAVDQPGARPLTGSFQRADIRTVPRSVCPALNRSVGSAHAVTGLGADLGSLRSHATCEHHRRP